MLKNNFTIEWPLLRNAMIFLIISLVLSVGVIGGTYYYRYQIIQWNDLNNKELKKIGIKLQELHDTAEILDKEYYLKWFDQLEQQGFFQFHPQSNFEEQRLIIEERVKTLLAELKLPSAEYKFLERKFDGNQYLKQDPGVKIYKAELILQLGLLHEGDILKLKEKFDFDAPIGLFDLQNCSIELLKKPDLDDVTQPNLNAICHFFWYTAEIEDE